MSTFNNIYIKDQVSTPKHYSQDDGLIIWEGAMWPSDMQRITIDWDTVTFGVTLEFNRWDASTSTQLNMQFHHFFFPKGAATNRGTTGNGGMKYMLTSYGTGLVAMKYIYFDETGLFGHADNSKDTIQDPVFGELKNKSWVLSKVYRA